MLSNLSCVFYTNVSRVQPCRSSGWDMVVVSGTIGAGCAQKCLKASDCKSRGSVLAWNGRSCRGGCRLETAARPRWTWITIFTQAATLRIILRNFWHVTVCVSSRLPPPWPCAKYDLRNADPGLSVSLRTPHLHHHNCTDTHPPDSHPWRG